MSQTKRKRKCDTHNVETLLRIFNENGREKNYPQITRLYNDEMGGDWTQDQITKKMQNVRGDIRRGKIQVVTAIPEITNDTGKKTYVSYAVNTPLRI